MSPRQFISLELVGVDLLIVQLEFLRDLPMADLQQILSRSVHQATLRPKKVLYRQDDSLEFVYILLSGSVIQTREGVAKNGQPEVYRRRVDKAGTLLSIYDLLFYDTYRTTTMTAGNGVCVLLQIDATAFNRLIFRFPRARGRLANMDMIRRMRTVPMIGHLDLVLLGFLTEATKPMTKSTGQYVYSSGEFVDCIYLVDQGQVSLEEADGRIQWATNGTVFGLVETHGRRRNNQRVMAHDAQATTETKIFQIDYDQFCAITCLDPDVTGVAEMRNRHDIVNGLSIFSQLSEPQRNRLVGFFSHYYFPINHLLIQQGEQADSFWVLLEGGNATIQALDENGTKLTSTISHGQTYFCETALLGELPQESSVEAVAGSQWLRLHWTDFQQFDDEEPLEIRGILEIDTEKLQEMESQQKQQKHTWLQPGELLIRLSRRHWIAFLRKAIPAIISVAALVALAWIGSLFVGAQLWIIVPTVLLILIAIGLFIWGAIDYFNDWIAVTDRRVVYQEKLILISKVRKEAPLDQIQQVDEERTLLGGWLNYGTMIVQTASTAGKIEFSYTRNFDALNAAIREQQELRLRHSAAESKTAISFTLSNRLGHAISLPSRVWQTVETPVEETSRRRLASVFRRKRPSADDERIIWRRHWIVLLPKLWWALLILILTLALVFGTAFIGTIIPDNASTLQSIVRAAVIIAFLVALARVSWVIVNWYNDTYEVDDRRITHIEKLPFGLRQSTSGALLARIQNVSTDIPSTIHWLFNYGNVRCQTAAEEGDFLFDGVHAPRDVADIIQMRMENYRRREEEREAQRRAQELPDWFEIYHRMETDDMPL